ncbi:hypothetical protein ABGY98_002832 [Salmonella enterica]|nr:hypothetical protein [Salmonella enterica]ECJ5893013.1 hypothetical protein [Salmonella enterica subsp. diarizonae]ECS3896957.1 hypothetical protein [Salmonella enterica subsp. diarizonae serovar 48:i:z]EAM6403918.1 hypothetical protein [Salmonella enterica]EAN2414914.1 hypothetical protein [Salmonella enterica]
MKLPERWVLHVKWVVVWLVLLPAILYQLEHSWLFISPVFGALVVGFCFGLFVSVVDHVFFFLCHFRDK